MDAETIARLDTINQRFYETHAGEFSRTRHGFWPGWIRLLPLLPARAPLRVLDAGCGNGRFALFLREHVRTPVQYLGVDSSSCLLDEARVRLAAFGDMRLELLELGAAWPRRAIAPGAFDLVALFGVLHHVPGRDRRRALLCELAASLAAGGRMAVSTWQFARTPRFQRRILPWTRSASAAGVAIDPGQLEPGDHLLAWGGAGGACRYCHDTTDAEMAELVAGLPLRLVDRYSADGATGDLNHYWIFG